MRRALSTPSSTATSRRYCKGQLWFILLLFFRVGVDIYGVGGFEGRADGGERCVEPELHVSQHAGGGAARGIAPWSSQVIAQNRPAVLGQGLGKLSDGTCLPRCRGIRSFSKHLGQHATPSCALRRPVAAIWRRVVRYRLCLWRPCRRGSRSGRRRGWPAEGGVCARGVSEGWVAPATAGEAHGKHRKAHAGSIFGSVHCGTACCR